MPWSGNRFRRDFLIEPGDFEVVHIEGNRNDRVKISAWERDDEPFDILLVHEDDVLEDRYRETRALLSDYGCADYEDTYTFEQNQKLCLVLSNTSARTRDKLIHLRITRITPRSKKMKGEREPAVQHREFHTLFEGTLSFIRSWYIAIVLIIATVILSASFLFVMPGLSAICGTAGSFLLTLYYTYRREKVSKASGGDDPSLRHN